MMTTAYNLATGAQEAYSLPPVEALRAAYLRSRGNHNTWQYPTSDVPVLMGRWTLNAGDWTVFHKTPPQPAQKLF